MSNLLKTIHAACRELGLDQDTRHLIQIAATGKASLTEMDEADMNKVLTALKDKGWKPVRKGKRHPKAKRADVRYIHVLWKLLSDEGSVREAGRKGLNAFIRSRFERKWGAVPIDVDALDAPEEINDVIMALRDWCARSGIEVV